MVTDLEEPQVRLAASPEGRARRRTMAQNQNQGGTQNRPDDLNDRPGKGGQQGGGGGNPGQQRQEPGKGGQQGGGGREPQQQDPSRRGGGGQDHNR
jgi:hypothetical protein